MGTSCVSDGVRRIYYNSPPMWVLLCGHRAVVTSEGSHSEVAELYSNSSQ